MEFFAWLEATELALRIGESWWFPLLESIHVVAVALTVGSLLMIDLRLLNVAARRYPVTAMTRELLPWTWVAFAIAVLTGLGLFITRAVHYLENPAFQFKLLSLALAGFNMAYLHFGPLRRVAAWDMSATTPVSVKLTASASLLFWAGVILAGRWIGHLS